MVLKCKMCGADLNIESILQSEDSVIKCEYCDLLQTIPRIDDEKKVTLFNRANHLRRKCEFDAASGVYQNIVVDFPQEAEAYWGLCLCKYGIEYVDDAASERKIPTCHRTAYESIFKDGNYEHARAYADSVAARQYEEEAAEIDHLQKRILEIADKEEPYDIFICYKEADEEGKRTADSVLAQDIYTELDKEGYKVFFSRITLEDKLGEEYEPYIFSALNSAKIMLAIGTDPAYYNAVWIQNEWRRFLEIMGKDSSKKIIPCYRGMDFYDIPEEFHNFQGQDMGKLGFLQDLLRGIKKLLAKNELVETVREKETVVIQQGSGNTNTAALLRRGYIELEDKNWSGADDFFEQVLNQEPENADAYLGKFYSSQQVDSLEHLYEKIASQLESQNSKEKSVSLSLNMWKEAEKIINRSNLHIYQEKQFIQEGLQEYGSKCNYLSSLEWHKNVRDAVTKLLDADKNYGRAKKYASQDSEVEQAINAFESDLEDKVKQASDAELESRKQAKQSFDAVAMRVQRDAETACIYRECGVEEKKLANCKETAEKQRKEKKALCELFQGVTPQKLAPVCAAIEEMSMEVYDKDAELEVWKKLNKQETEIAQLAERERKNDMGEIAALESVLREHREKMEEAKEDMERAERNSALYNETTEGCLCQIIAWLGLGIGILSILASGALTLFGNFTNWPELLVGAQKTMWFSTHVCIPTVAIGGLLFFLTRIPADRQQQSYNHIAATRKSELHTEEELIKATEEQLQEKKKEQQEKADIIAKRSKGKLEPILKMNTANIRSYDCATPLRYEKLQDTEITFQVAVNKVFNEIKKQAILFCYEKKSFYPVEIIKKESGAKGATLIAIVTNMGLSVKLEEFKEEDHFLLLLGSDES